MRTDRAPVVLSLLCCCSCGPDVAEMPSVGSDGGSGGTSVASTSSTASGEESESSSGSEGCAEVYVGDLVVADGAGLSAMAEVRHVMGDLEVVGVAAADLDSLGCLVEVDGDLTLRENEALETLSGAGSLEAVGGTISVLGNPRLRSLSGFEALREAGAGIRLMDNAELSSVEMPSLERIGTFGLVLGDCVSLSSSEPAEAWGDNASLESLDGLEALVSVSGVFIAGQTSLRSLAGLRELAERGADFGTTLHAQVNPELPSSEIDAFVQAAGLGTVRACQNKDDSEICTCLPD